MPELRYNLGHGYLRYPVSTKDKMISLLVKLRHCKGGFCYNINDKDGICWSKNIQSYTEVLKTLNA
jgi:hypothetical protein